MFAQSAFIPIAVGLFGLGTGYFIWGGQGLFGWPKSSPETEKTIGLWGIWMPGFMQFITGIFLFVGITWFQVFNPEAGKATQVSGLYMAALAFTAYGVHWFVMGHRRYIGASAQPDGWMAIPYLILSILGAVVFFSQPGSSVLGPGDTPIAIVFIGLSLIYASEILARFLSSALFVRLVALWQVLTGIWLMYTVIAITIDLATTLPHLPI